MITINTNSLGKLLESARSAGYRFVAPVRDGTISLFRPVDRIQEIALDLITPVKSPKEYFFSDHECILSYKRSGKSLIELSEPSKEDYAPPTVIFGCRPCDAAGPGIIREVMTWDCDDKFFLDRLESTVIITIACVEADEACYCTSVDMAPDSETGSDILLTPSKDKPGVQQEYLVKAVTEKGSRFIEQTKGWSDGTVNPAPAIEGLKSSMKPTFDAERVRKWLDTSFEDKFWDTATLACISCGTCTYTCPTCHCYDIIDEGNTDGGKRLRNWDACMMELFTLHASGHNPRPTKSNRFRQRLTHKFKYYPDLFNRILCTGCGRCQRYCPTDHALKNLLEQIDKLVSTESQAAEAVDK